jgi:hypothetical protein
MNVFSSQRTHKPDKITEETATKQRTRAKYEKEVNHNATKKGARKQHIKSYTG